MVHIVSIVYPGYVRIIIFIRCPYYGCSATMLYPYCNVQALELRGLAQVAVLSEGNANAGNSPKP